MVQIRHMNRNGWTLQQILVQLKEKEEKEPIPRRVPLRDAVQGSKEYMKLSSYGGFVSSKSICLNCVVRYFCKANVPEGYTVLPSWCSQIRKFVQQRLMERKLRQRLGLVRLKEVVNDESGTRQVQPSSILKGKFTL
jgi:topoisomerase IA-like protein